MNEYFSTRKYVENAQLSDFEEDDLLMGVIHGNWNLKECIQIIDYQRADQFIFKAIERGVRTEELLECIYYVSREMAGKLMCLE